jgi:hypothetical protein
MKNIKIRVRIFLVAVACTFVSRYLLLLISVNLWPPQTINFDYLRWIGHGLGLATFFIVERHMNKRYMASQKTADSPEEKPTNDSGRFDA